MTSSLAPAAPVVGAATRAVRRARAVQLDEVHDAVASGGWAGGGFRSPSAWLAHLSGESFGRCKHTLRLADRIQQMPVVRARFAAGDLAESALRLLADAWHESIAEVFTRDEDLLVGWAVGLSLDDFTVVLDTWRLHADPTREERTAQDRFDERRLHVSELMDGVGVVDGVLDAEGTSLVREALRVLSRPAGRGDARTAAQRRADALVMMAKFFIERRPPVPGEKRNKPKVVATFEATPATDEPDESDATTPPAPPGGTLETNSDRTVVGIDTVRRLACDAGIHRLITGPESTNLDYGRRTQSVSDPLFDVLLLRDHGCRWAGCSVPAGLCDAHHAVHWLDLGETEPDNLVLLCWYHHHLLHEQHWRIEPLGAGHFQLHDPHGGHHQMRPPMIGLALPQPLPLSPPPAA